MNEPTLTRTAGGVAILRIDNPPVNALDQSVRAGLAEALNRLCADPEISAIVLAGSGMHFSAGADIGEFGEDEKAPGLKDIVARIDASPKPVVAAIHGVCLGGGLQLALACHYRVAAPGAQLGLPEVKLGLIPGAGGTQLLPRAIGPVLAVRLIASGEALDAATALAAGAVDEVSEDVIPAATALAARAAASPGPLPRLREDETRLDPIRADRGPFEEALAAAVGRPRGLEAPLVAAEAVGWSLDHSFEDAVALEQAAFARLFASPEARALRHAFLAERGALKLRDVPAGTTPRSIGKVAVIGAGTMGTGIAMSFASAGFPVTIIEQEAAPLERGLALIRRNYEASAARGRLPQAEAEARIARIEGRIGLAEAGDADLVIEAVFETMAIKKEVFGRLGELAKPGAVLATNTSFLDVNEIAAATSRPQDVLGMHFFSPANVMRLCEVVRGDRTAPDALAAAVRVAQAAGKVPVTVGVCDGFVGNRMLTVRGRQADKLLYQGVMPQQMDAVLTRFGMPMGHFAMLDLAGLDISWLTRQSQGQKSPIEDTLCEAGRLGQKAGRGFYIYNPGSRTPQPDPNVEDLIRDTVSRLGLPLRSVDDSEVLERLLLPMINEGARILEEGIASRPGDIDVVWLYGYGWPLRLGGPMFHADQLGLRHVAERLAYYAAQDGDAELAPAPLLARLAAEGSSFGAWSR